MLPVVLAGVVETPEASPGMLLEEVSPFSEGKMQMNRYDLERGLVLFLAYVVLSVIAGIIIVAYTALPFWLGFVAVAVAAWALKRLGEGM